MQHPELSPVRFNRATSLQKWIVKFIDVIEFREEEFQLSHFFAEMDRGVSLPCP